MLVVRPTVLWTHSVNPVVWSTLSEWARTAAPSTHSSLTADFGVVLVFDWYRPSLSGFIPFGRLTILQLWRWTLRTAVENAENNAECRTQPSFTPALTLKGLVTCPLLGARTCMSSLWRRVMVISFRRHSYFSRAFNPAFPINGIEGFCQVEECHVKPHVLFTTFLPIRAVYRVGYTFEYWNPFRDFRRIELVIGRRRLRDTLCDVYAILL